MSLPADNTAGEMSDMAVKIAANVAQVRQRIADAAVRAGRDPNDVKLVAVTKYVAPEVVRRLVAADCLELGESRPQELWRKADALADLPIRWHLIGHLQRNKVRRSIAYASMIHSIDSRRLLDAVEGELQLTEQPRNPLPVLLEVNISGESAKHGFVPEEIEPLLPELAGYRHLSVRGLMCMAGLEGGPDAARRDFAALRELRDRLRPACPPGVTLDELSMGMSGDFETAIEQGATIVRIGSALFEGLG